MRDAILDAAPELAAVGHQMRIVDEAGADLGAAFPVAPLHRGFDLRRLIRLGLPVFPSSIMYRRAARTLRAADFEIYDWYLFTDILRAGPAAYLHEQLGAYRIHTASQVARERGEVMTQRMAGLYRRRLAEMPQHRADFMARGLMWAWHGLFDEGRIDGSVLDLVRASFTFRAIGPFIDAFRWARANKAAHVRR